MRARILIVALIAIGILIPTALVFSPQKAAGASMILSVLDGSADVARDAADFVRAADGDALSAGDRIRTSADGHALVTFLDGSTVEIEPATTITVVEATAAPSGAIAIRLEQALGRTWSSVQKLTHPESKFEIKTPSTTATVRGTGFVTDVAASGATTVTTTEGIVEVNAQGLTVVVPSGAVTTVETGGRPSPPVPGPAARNTLRFGLHSPAHLAVVDPHGRTCGIVPTGPTVVRQIPGCLATEPGIGPQLVDVPDAIEGTYVLVIETVAPGGDFVATASAFDAGESLSFNYFLTGGGPAGTKFGSSLIVGRGADGTLTAAGLAKLTLIDRAPTRVVLLSTLPRPTASGTPNPSLFAPLPRFGFTPGIVVTPAPAGQTPAAATATPTPTASPTPTEIAAPEPTRAPTQAPIRTLPPPPRPPPPTPVATATAPPTPPPTPTPSPTPAPTPTGPGLFVGIGSPGSPVTLSGQGWSSARITVHWEDGTPLLQVTADAAGSFAVAWTIPITTSVGTHRMTASDGARTAAAQVSVYAPTLSVSCGTTTEAVSFRGEGWPAAARYAIRSSLLSVPLGGTVGGDGSFTTSFVPTSGALPGDYQFQASAGSLLAPPQSCTLR